MNEKQENRREKERMLNITDEQKSAQSRLKRACEKYAKTEGNKFITGEDGYDITDDAQWAAYVEGLKSQFEGFDELIQITNENVDLTSLEYYND